MKLNRRMGYVALLAIIVLVMAGVGRAEVRYRPYLPVGANIGYGVCLYGTYGPGAYQSIQTSYWRMGASPAPIVRAYRTVHHPWPQRYMQVIPRPPIYPVVPSPQPNMPRPPVMPMSRGEVQVLRALR